MNNKFITSSQFFNNWARTNKDPDGNYLEKYTIGGENDSYFQYIRLKYAEIHEILTEIYAEIDEIMQKTQQIELENGKNGENSGKNSEIEVKSTENPQKYKWVSEKTNCFKCKSLDGKIFDHKPNVEEIAHINCKCEIVEVSEIEVEMAERAREIEIGKRDRILDKLNEDAKTLNEKDGKFYDKNGNQIKIGNCAKYVAESFRKNGIDIGRPKIRYEEEQAPSARDYGPMYEKEGFIPIYTHREGNRITKPQNLEYQKGDIMILQPPKQRDKDGNILYDEKNEPKILERRKHGHIAMHNGKEWVSDFKQTNKDGVIWKESENNRLIDFAIYRKPNWSSV